MCKKKQKTHHGCVKWLAEGRGRTCSPALFVLLLFEQISVLYDACMCVLCAQLRIQGEQVRPLFVLWLTIKHGASAHRSEYPLSTVGRPRALVMKSYERRRGLNRDNALVSSPPMGHVSLFSRWCVFSRRHGDQPSSRSQAAPRHV